MKRHHWFFLLFVILCQPFVMGALFYSNSGFVVSGANIWWDSSTSCPAGYTENTNMRGLYPVGMPLGGTIQNVGTALSNGENRPAGAHTHTVSAPTTGSGSATGYVVTWNSGGTQQSLTSNNGGLVAGTNAPYRQGLFCQKL